LKNKYRFLIEAHDIERPSPFKDLTSFYRNCTAMYCCIYIIFTWSSLYWSRSKPGLDLPAH